MKKEKIIVTEKKKYQYVLMYSYQTTQRNNGLGFEALTADSFEEAYKKLDEKIKLKTTINHFVLTNVYREDL